MKLIATARERRPGAVLATVTAWSLLALAVLGTGSADAASAAPPAPSSTPPAAGRVTVPQGIGAGALSRARAVGPASPSTRETVSFILQARRIRALRARVDGGVSRHLTVGAFAARYGQTAARITALETYLTSFGIACVPLPDGLDVTTTGTVGEYNRALGVHQSDYRLAAVPARAGRAGRPAATFHGTAGPASLPARLAPYVLSILGLTSYPAGMSNAVHTPALPRGVQPAATWKGDLKPSDFARLYHLTPLLRSGYAGQGQTIGIVTLASMKVSDATHFWSSVLKISTPPGRVTLDNVDGGSGPVSDAAGSGETTLDVEQSGGLAPRANIVVYQAPNTDAGFIDGFATAASQGTASAVSSSWGESETAVRAGVAAHQESSTFARAFNEIFLELAAQGQSSFVAAGDSGAYDASGDLGTTNLSVDEPGSSPWTTDAGGTTLAGTIPVSARVKVVIKAQRAWGWDWLWPHWKQLGGKSEKQYAVANLGGSGGGFSQVEGTPGYQSRWLEVHKFSAVRYLTPASYVTKDGVRLPTRWKFTVRPQVSTGTRAGRAVPDLSADADPYTGYLVYFTGFSSGGPLQGDWGGTSFVAPQLAGVTAIIDSYLGRRVGFWNPAIYRFAATSRSPFTPLSSAGRGNDNLYYSGTPGRRFNAGTGLGTPNFDVLAKDFR